MISEVNDIRTHKYDIIHDFQGVYTHLQKRAWKSAAEVALGSIKLSKFKISDGDLPSSSTRPGSSSASDASRPGPAMCDIVPVNPSQSSAGGPPSKPPPVLVVILHLHLRWTHRRRPLHRRRERGGARQARRVPSAGTILGSCWSGKP